MIRNETPSIQDIARTLVDSGGRIKRDSSRAYLIPEGIDLAKKYIEGDSKKKDNPALVTYFTLAIMYLEYVWSRNSSAASLQMTLNQQDELVKSAGVFLEMVGSSLSSENMQALIEATTDLRVSYEGLTRQRVIVHESLRMTDQEKDAMHQYSPKGEVRKKFFKLLIENDILKKYSLPVVLLKGGFRSFYLMNLDDISLRKSPSILFAEILKEFLVELKTFAQNKVSGLTDQDFTVILLSKTLGETKSTQITVPIITSLGYNTAILDIAAFYKRDYRISGEVKGNYFIVLDDVITRGTGVANVRKLLKELTGKGVLSYGATLFRGDINHADKMGVSSLITTTELAEAGLWTPEISLLTIENPYWPSIDLRNNLINELFTYYHASPQFPAFANKFGEIVEEAYSMTGNEDTTMFCGVKVEGKISRDELVNYLMNVHLLVWRTILESHSSDAALLDRSNQVVFLETLLELERATKFSVKPISDLMKNHLKTPIRTWEDIRGVFVDNNILMHAREGFEETRSKVRVPLPRPTSKRFSESEIQAIVDNELRLTLRKQSLTGETYLEDDIKQVRERKIKLLRMLNAVWGKDEKILAEYQDAIQKIARDYDSQDA